MVVKFDTNASGAKFSHGVTFWVRFASGNVYTQCVTLHTVCNFTHFVQMFVNMSIVLCDGNLREQFVSQIYAVLS